MISIKDQKQLLFSLAGILSHQFSDTFAIVFYGFT